MINTSMVIHGIVTAIFVISTITFLFFIIPSLQSDDGRCTICDGFAALSSAKLAIQNSGDYQTYGNHSEINFKVIEWPDDRHVRFMLTYPRIDGKTEIVNMTCRAYYGGSAGKLEERVI